MRSWPQDRPLSRSFDVRFGRNRPVARSPRLSLKNYLMKALPSPPPACNYQRKARETLQKIYGNDVLGDCVIAGMAHTVGVLTGNAGDQFYYDPGEIVAMYSAIGGYIPGNGATDNGCDEVTALNYWREKGAPSGVHNIAGYLAVDPANIEEYRTALWLFENLFFGLELPDEYVNPFPSASGFVWSVAGEPDPNNGHCIVGMGYDSTGVAISTWGMTGLMSDAAVAKYCAASAGGALYTVLSQDAIAKATLKAPNGFDFSQLTADFQAIGG